VELEKESGTVLGMDVGSCDTALLVERVHEDGSIVSLNEAQPALAISPGDYIVGVNHVGGQAERMLAEIGESGSLTLELCKAQPFRAKLVKEGPLGVTLLVLQRVVVVQDIHQGPVQSWNEDNPQWQIMAGDQIVEVNGARDEPTQILEALKEEGGLDLLVVPLGASST